MNEEERKLKSAFEAAKKRVDNGPVGGSGGIEAEYAKAYQRLVVAGFAQQIKRKYRR